MSITQQTRKGRSYRQVDLGLRAGLPQPRRQFSQMTSQFGIALELLDELGDVGRKVIPDDPVGQLGYAVSFGLQGGFPTGSLRKLGRADAFAAPIEQRCTKRGFGIGRAKEAANRGLALGARMRGAFADLAECQQRSSPSRHLAACADACRERRSRNRTRDYRRLEATDACSRMRSPPEAPEIPGPGRPPRDCSPPCPASAPRGPQTPVRDRRARQRRRSRDRRRPCRAWAPRSRRILRVGWRRKHGCRSGRGRMLLDSETGGDDG